MGLITVDLRSRKQLWEQLVDNVKNLILMGELSPDEKLPSVRSLARELGIKTFLVKPIHPKEEIQIVLKRFLEKIVLHFYEKERMQKDAKN